MDGRWFLAGLILGGIVIFMDKPGTVTPESIIGALVPQAPSTSASSGDCGCGATLSAPADDSLTQHPAVNSPGSPSNVIRNPGRPTIPYRPDPITIRKIVAAQSRSTQPPVRVVTTQQLGNKV